MKFQKTTLLAAALLLANGFPAQAINEALAKEPGSNVKRRLPRETREAEDDATADANQKSVRTTRPLTHSASVVGKTPFIGALIDMNLIPYVGLGAGYGYFSSNSVTGSLIPVFAQVYALPGNFSPFLEGGADFLTVKFQSANTLLNSTFQGTQFIVGGGAEYRFDFGLCARLEVVRFINARVWAPGAQLGYSFSINY